MSGKKKRKRLIPETHCIRVCMWRNEDEKYNVNKYEGHKPGMSSMETGAGSLTALVKILKRGFEAGYTHFQLMYPVAMMGGTKNEPKLLKQTMREQARKEELEMVAASLLGAFEGAAGTNMERMVKAVTQIAETCGFPISN